MRGRKVKNDLEERETESFKGMRGERREEKMGFFNTEGEECVVILSLPIKPQKQISPDRGMRSSLSQNGSLGPVSKDKQQISAAPVQLCL